MKESPLSERETDVLRRFAAGAELPAIAAELFLSLRNRTELHGIRGDQARRP